MVHLFRAPDMDSLHDKMCRGMIYASAGELDSYNSTEATRTTVIGEADSMVLNAELRRLWVPESRWRMMARQYIDPEAFDAWLAGIEDRFVSRGKNRGAQVLRTNVVKPRVGGKGTVRSLGSCMLSLSFSMMPTPKVVLHSRTSYMGYLSLLDMNTAYTAARYISQIVGIPEEEFQFVWFLESMQYHAFRTLAFPLGEKEERKEFLQVVGDEKYPATWPNKKHLIKWQTQDKEGVLYSGMPFTSYRRVRKRYHTEVKGYDFADRFTDHSTGKSDHRAYAPLPSTRLADVDFSAIGRPFTP